MFDAACPQRPRRLALGEELLSAHLLDGAEPTLRCVGVQRLVRRVAHRDVYGRVRVSVARRAILVEGESTVRFEELVGVVEVARIGEGEVLQAHLCGKLRGDGTVRAGQQAFG